MIPYGHQSISEDDIEAVIAVLRSDFLTQGSTVGQFEQALCGYTGAKYGVAVSSGTAALHLACLALGLRKGDWLWTTPITFVASANCGLYCGAQVDFVDIDPETWNVSVSALEEKLAVAKQSGCLPKILVVVHMCGLPADMKAIHQLSEQYGFSIIEDACHAMGAQDQELAVGAGRYSNITVFSFHPVKPITTGEGGAAVTNNKLLANRMKLLRSHGVTRDDQYMDRGPDGPWYYQQIELGYNYRMSDLQAALGWSQLQRLDQFIEKRQRIAAFYDDQLKGLPVQLPSRVENSESSWHLYVIRLSDQLVRARKAIIEGLRLEGVTGHVHYIPVHTQPFYRQFGFKNGDFLEAEKYYSEAITLPIYPDMDRKAQQKVVSVLTKLIEQYASK